MSPSAQQTLRRGPLRDQGVPKEGWWCQDPKSPAGLWAQWAALCGVGDSQTQEQDGPSRLPGPRSCQAFPSRPRPREPVGGPPRQQLKTQ